MAARRFRPTGLSNIRMTLSPQDLHLLKELKAAGERGRAIQAPHIRVVLDRLARGGFVVGRPMGGELVNYRITQRGQIVLVEHDLKQPCRPAVLRGAIKQFKKKTVGPLFPLQARSSLA